MNTIKGATAGLLGTASASLAAELRAIDSGEPLLTVGYGVMPKPAPYPAPVPAVAVAADIDAAALATSGLGLCAEVRENTGTDQFAMPNIALDASAGTPHAGEAWRITGSQIDPSSALPSAPAGDRPAEHPPLSVMMGETAPPDVDDDLTPFSSDLNLDPVDPAPATNAVLARFFSDAPLPTLDITMRTDLRDPRAADRRERAVAEVAVAPLRFGVWSDGFVELQRAGTTVATLTRADADELADHMIALRGGAK